MEDIHGQEGSEDHGPGVIVAICLDTHLKRQQPTTLTRSQPSWACPHAEFAHSLGPRVLCLGCVRPGSLKQQQHQDGASESRANTALDVLCAP